jgi:hypothetical protein
MRECQALSWPTLRQVMQQPLDQAREAFVFAQQRPEALYVRRW